MPKPIAIAMIAPIHTAYGNQPVQVPVIKSKARHCVASFYAPNWRPMAFRTVEQAVAKIARHPGFQGWAVAPAVAS